MTPRDERVTYEAGVHNVTSALTEEQASVCRRFGVPPVKTGPDVKVGIAKNVAKEQDLWPLNGLRHPPEADTAGWYLWAGEAFPENPRLWVPLHAAHLAQYRPICLPYLALPPGWRFLLAPGYEDVWYDETLLVLD